jgi:hypothetical protein
MRNILLVFLTFISYQSFSQINLLQNTSFGGVGAEYSRNIVSFSDNTFLVIIEQRSGVGGIITEPSNGEQDLYLIKYDSNMNILWQKSLGGSGFDVPAVNGMIKTNDGNVVLVATSSSQITGDRTIINNSLNEDTWIVKLTPSGTILWQKAYATLNISRPTCIHETDNGNLIVGIQTWDSNGNDKTEVSRGGSDYWILKLDATGELLWEKTLGGDQDDEIVAIESDQNENIYCIGSSSSNISSEKTESCSGFNDVWLVKLDPDGVILFDKTIGGGAEDGVQSFLLAESNLYIGALSNSDISPLKSENNKGGYDIWLLKLDLDGEIIWENTIGGDQYDGAGKILNENGSIILAGASSSSSSEDKSEDPIGSMSTSSDVWILEISKSSGEIFQEKIFGGDNWEYSTDLIKHNSNYYVLGSSLSGASEDHSDINHGEEDIWLLKFDINVLSTGTESVLDNKTNLYPNPSSESTTIAISSNSKESVLISITDMDGKVVYSNNISINNGENQFVVSTKNFAHGIYNVKMEQGQSFTVRKLVVQ